MRSKVVVGGTYEDYQRWLYGHGFSERDAVFVGQEHERLMGLELKKDDVVRLGPVSEDFEELLHTRFR